MAVAAWCLVGGSWWFFFFVVFLLELTAPELYNWAFFMARSLAHMHEQGWMHRNVSLHHYVISNEHENQCALIDFELAREATDASHPIYLRRRHQKIPMHWSPPEWLQPLDPFSCVQSDVWMFGIALWELLHVPWGSINLNHNSTLNNTTNNSNRGRRRGRSSLSTPTTPGLPFAGFTQSHDLYQYLDENMRSGAGHVPLWFGDNCPEPLRDLIVSCCQFSLEDRPSMSDVCERLGELRGKVLEVFFFFFFFFK